MHCADDLINEWIRDAGSDPVTVSDDARVEAQENCWTLKVTAEQANELTEERVEAAVAAVVEAKREQLRSRRLQPMLLYAWFDEQSGNDGPLDVYVALLSP